MSSSIDRQNGRDFLSTWDAFELEAGLKSRYSSLVRLHIRPNYLFVNLINIELIAAVIISVAYFLFFTRESADVVTETNILRTAILTVLSATIGMAIATNISRLTLPDRLAISRDGILLFRNLAGFTANYTNLSWQNILSITSGVGTEKEACVDILRDRTGPGQKTIRLKMDRQKAYNMTKFAEALRTFAPRELVADDLCEKLGIKESGAYTAMWLNELADTQSQSRKRIGDLDTGLVIADRYKVVNKLGAGGQGTAYLVESVEAQSSGLLVLKEFILPTHAGAEVVGRSIEMIKREFDILSAIDSEYIVKVKDFFINDLRAYLVLEHLDGESLRSHVVSAGPMIEESAWHLANQMCKILHCLHKQDRPVIHRDFSPDNLILTTTGRLSLIDFNVAQFYEGQASKTIVGKKSYVPPEQLRGESVPASDLYALGATLYFISTGKDPEPISTAYPQSLNQQLSDEFDSLVSFLTAPNVSERCQNTDALAARLQHHELAREPIKVIDS